MAIWKDTKLEYSDGKPIYKGLNAFNGISDDDVSWRIYKYTWDGDDCTRIEGPIIGSWTGRASLNWA